MSSQPLQLKRTNISKNTENNSWRPNELYTIYLFSQEDMTVRLLFAEDELLLLDTDPRRSEKLGFSDETNFYKDSE